MILDAIVERVKNQYAEMRQLRENLDDCHVLIWMDFQRTSRVLPLTEVQSAYWNNAMVTLHTQVIYFPKSFGQSHQSIVGISKSLSQRLVHICNAEQTSSYDQADVSGFEGYSLFNRFTDISV